MQTTPEFNITELSVHDFKKLLTDIKDKASFEASLLKQVGLNSHFWSYLLIYDCIVNDGTMELSGKFIEDVLEPEGQTWNNPFRFDYGQIFWPHQSNNLWSEECVHSICLCQCVQQKYW